jgi:phosphoglycolate phosphatase
VGDLRGRLIVFDLDGTLVDSRRDLADSANLLIRELGGQTLPEEAIGRMVGEGARLLVERALRASGLEAEADGPVLPRHLARFLQIYDGRLLEHTVAYPGISQALVHARGRARLAVLTNKPARPSAAVLEGLGLRMFFEEVIGGDSRWPRKPEPAALQHLMQQAGAVPASTLLVGDSAIDHETARRAGVRCCLAAYGFGYLTFPPDRLTGEEWIVDAPSELTAIIEQFTAV